MNINENIVPYNASLEKLAFSFNCGTKPIFNAFLKESLINSSATLAMPFPPFAACKNLDLRPVNLRFLRLRLTKNSFATVPTH